MRRARFPGILFLSLFLTGIIPAYPAAQDLTEDERQWLARASRLEREGWIYLHIEGEPFERGFQHGYLLAPEIKKLFDAECHVVHWQTPKDFDFFVEQAKSLFAGKVKPEYEQELRGMALGLKRAGVENIGYDELVAHNAYFEVVGYWWPWAKKEPSERVSTIETGGCSAFAATGSYTADGGVVLAHNTWFYYPMGSWCNVILDLAPDKGHRMLMQSIAGYIHSGTDFFLCSSGIAGTETTIGGFTGYDTSGTPEFCRVREAMQYADSLDEWAEIMIRGNTGGYANSWLLADVRSSEIARLELGAKYHRWEKKTDGCFYGSNVAEDRDLLLNETKLNWTDISTTNVARRESWKRLMKIYRGRIDVEAAKTMLADHYDSYLKKERPGYRSICGHGELDPATDTDDLAPFRPSGAVDGKVLDSEMARSMSFWARWGSSCGMPFLAEKFHQEHTQYDWLRGYLIDRPTRSWTVFEATR
jgi:hypothetical protein